MNKKLADLIRERCGSFAAFAVRMGWPRQRVSKIIKPGYVPRLGTACQMAKVLNCSLDELADYFNGE